MVSRRLIGFPERFAAGFRIDGDRLVAAPGQLPEGVGDGVVLPGFVDAHCHVLPMGLDLAKLHLGLCQTPDDVLQAVRDWHDRTDANAWLHAVHYDQTKFAGAEHLSRDQLDKISDTRPILLRHSNGHASVANSAALRVAGVTEETTDPTGGTYVRDASGRLTGVLLERAHDQVTASAPAPTDDEMVAAILLAGRRMAELGITAATDMMTGRWSLERELAAYHEAAEKGCAVRVRLSMQWATVLGPRALDSGRRSELIAGMKPDRCRPIGLKIFADGAIGSATAAIYGQYATTGGNGQLIYSPERLTEMLKAAVEADFSVAVHAIGDRAVDHVLDAFVASGEPGRHRLEHAMILSDEQIERIAQLGCHVTHQPEFLLRFGHAYRKQVPDVASKIKRTRSLLAAGVPMSFNSDRPIVPGDPWDGIRTAVNRPDGFDPSESIPWERALELYTVGGNIANGDAKESFADYQVYDADPRQGGKLMQAVRHGEVTFRHGS